jgi:hypothetical protein
MLSSAFFFSLYSSNTILRDIKAKRQINEKRKEKKTRNPNTKNSGGGGGAKSLRGHDQYLQTI